MTPSLVPGVNASWDNNIGYVMAYIGNTTRATEYLCLHQTFRRHCLEYGAPYADRLPYSSSVRNCDSEVSFQY